MMSLGGRRRGALAHARRRSPGGSEGPRRATPTALCEVAVVNHAAVASLASLVASLLVAAVSVRMGRAAGWRDQAPFALVAFTASLYALANLPSTAGPWVSDPLVVASTRLQL